MELPSKELNATALTSTISKGSGLSISPRSRTIVWRHSGKTTQGILPWLTSTAPSKKTSWRSRTPAWSRPSSRWPSTVLRSTTLKRFQKSCRKPWQSKNCDSFFNVCSVESLKGQRHISWSWLRRAPRSRTYKCRWTMTCEICSFTQWKTTVPFLSSGDNIITIKRPHSQLCYGQRNTHF